ncbi:RNA polymerase sigma factor [Chitinophaga polysaccharea]|uniref:RNA polymerase sigma factor n=1 Tax=Chitinophaga polysaccharea TaxID=1293035 RepID=UPI00163D17CE|nr:sigma-70 family RNA polymerase sigma factor [Chitinophaga polysaccharea]
MRGAKFHIAKELLISISEGDEVAFRELFYGALPWLTSFIQRMVKSPEGAQEIVQETFIRIWLSRDKLPGLLEPQAWIVRVASNECFTWFHKQATLRRVTGISEEEGTAAANYAEDRLQVQETLQLIREAVAQLPPQRKKIYQLSREEGLKIQEIADRLHCSPSYVKNTLSAALSFIRGRLTAAGKILSLLFFLFLTH